MSGRGAIVGLCMLCALLVSAVAAQSAGAITGTTAFTCAKAAKAPSQFTDSHCKFSGEGEFKHVAIAENTTTSLRANAAGEATKFKWNVGGLNVTFTATGLEAGSNSWMTDALDPNGEHYAHGEGTAKYTGVTVSVAKCFVYKDEAGAKSTKGVVDTEKIRGTTTGQGMGVKFTPAEGEVFARFWILDAAEKTSAEGGECSIGATYQVTGSLIGTPGGVTVNFTHAGTTEQNTLKMGSGAGNKAGLEGSVTFEAEDTADGTDTWAPLSPTTVTT